MDVDMELLRSIDKVREALSGFLEGKGAGEVEGLVRQVRTRACDTQPRVEVAVDLLERVLAHPLSVLQEGREDWESVLAELLEAMEGVVFDSTDADADQALDRALMRVEGELQKGEEGAPVEESGDGDENEVYPASESENVREEIDLPETPSGDSLHAAAAYLVQMDPKALDSLAILRDSLAAVETRWTGSDHVRNQFQERLRELDAVVGNRRSRKTRRVEAADRVGAVLEAAMLEQEETLQPGESQGPEIASELEEAKEAEPPSEHDPCLGASGEDEDEESSPSLETSPAESQGEEPGSIPTAMDADPELVLDFVAEGLDYLNQAEAALLLLEGDPSDTEAVNVTFRAFHTIKGVSAFLDLNQVAQVAHEAETLLSQVREGSLEFTEAAADLFLRSADVLRGLLVDIREVVNGGTAAEPEGLATLLALLRDPDLASKVARNDSLGLERASPRAPEEPAQGGGGTQAPAAKSEEERRPETARTDPAITGPGEDSVRIRTERLDRLVDLVGELVVSHSMISQDPEVLLTRGDLGKKVGHSQKILRELQDLSTSLRMVPLKPAFHKISRVVRDVSRKSGKRVELITSGEETELDRSMVGVITDPLVHMVRNSVDHGIESAEERREAGKPEHGSLFLTARQAGGNVVVEIRDDGRGLNREKILAKAIQRGLVEPDRTLSDNEVHSLIFHPGFSTADQVTDLSGRGVGMDVVKRAVESLRGRIEIQSKAGEGTRFSIYLPLTLAITDGMLVRVGEERYIIPTVKIQLSFRPGREDLWSVSDRGEVVTLHGQLIPIARLHRLFRLHGCQEDPTEGILVVVGEGSRKTCLLVDELLGQQQFVVKALTGQVAQTPGVAGGAILGDGGVGLILDPDEIIELARTSKGDESGPEQAAVA